jgi:8-amino-7-oxononanoate synthase
VQDRLNHPGLIDAARLAGCRLRRYPHLDAGGAMRQLRQSPEGAAMLVTEGVFGMDGDAAPLRALTLVARMQQALTCVDDHGIGVTGPEGRGSVAAAGLGVEDVPLLLVSLGKALGASGAVVAGDDVLIGHLAETARPYLHAAALPPAQTAAALAAVRQARRDAWRRERLHERVAQFRAGAGRAGLTLMPSESPIQPLLATSCRGRHGGRTGARRLPRLADPSAGGARRQGPPAHHAVRLAHGRTGAGPARRTGTCSRRAHAPSLASA